MARSPVRIRASPSFVLQSATLEPSIEAFSVARIMTRNKHNKDKKLHNSDEKLHNSHEPDLTWQEMTDLSPEDDVAGGGKSTTSPMKTATSIRRTSPTFVVEVINVLQRSGMRVLFMDLCHDLETF